MSEPAEEDFPVWYELEENFTGKGVFNWSKVYPPSEEDPRTTLEQMEKVDGED